MLSIGPHVRRRLAQPSMNFCDCFLREASKIGPNRATAPEQRPKGASVARIPSQLLGRPFKKYATTEGDPIDRCTRSSLRTTYFGALIELGRNSVNDRMICAEEVPHHDLLQLHLKSRAMGGLRDISAPSSHDRLIERIDSRLFIVKFSWRRSVR